MYTRVFCVFFFPPSSPSNEVFYEALTANDTLFRFHRGKTRRKINNMRAKYVPSQRSFGKQQGEKRGRGENRSLRVYRVIRIIFYGILKRVCPAEKRRAKEETRKRTNGDVCSEN